MDIKIAPYEVAQGNWSSIQGTAQEVITTKRIFAMNVMYTCKEKQVESHLLQF